MLVQIFKTYARTDVARLQIALAEIPYIRARLRTMHEVEQEGLKETEVIGCGWRWAMRAWTRATRRCWTLRAGVGRRHFGSGDGSSSASARPSSGSASPTSAIAALRRPELYHHLMILVRFEANERM